MSALPGVPAARIDSVAMRASEATGAPAIALYAARGSWSYTVFEAGEPILALESHLGRPTLDGDIPRAAELLGLSAETLALSLERCFDPDRLTQLITELGLRPFRREAALTSPTAAPRRADDPSATLERIPPGTWAALPPLGVVLVKAVEARARDGADEPTYVIVHGMSTLDLPVARAEQMGMRPVASPERAAALLELIDDGVSAPPRDYDPARVKGWLDLVRGGDLEAIARVFATLCALEDRRKLYAVESALKATAQDWLAAELSTALKRPPDDLERELLDACD